MGRIGMGEVIVIVLVVLILFGAKRLPEIGEAIGKALKSFKREVKDTENGIKDVDHEKK